MRRTGEGKFVVTNSQPPAGNPGNTGVILLACICRSTSTIHTDRVKRAVPLRPPGFIGLPAAPASCIIRPLEKRAGADVIRVWKCCRFARAYHFLNQSRPTVIALAADECCHHHAGSVLTSWGRCGFIGTRVFAVPDLPPNRSHDVPHYKATPNGPLPRCTHSLVSLPLLRIPYGNFARRQGATCTDPVY